MESVKSHVANLIRLAKADGKLTQEEVIYIKSVAIKLGVSNSEFNEVVLNIESQKKEVPLSKEGRVSQLYDLVALMHIDLQMHDEEKEVIAHVGELMGFSSLQLGELYDKVHSAEKLIGLEEFEKILL